MIDNIKELWKTSGFFRLAIIIAFVGIIILAISPVPAGGPTTP
jgi:hypothetical protein